MPLIQEKTETKALNNDHHANCVMPDMMRHPVFLTCSGFRLSRLCRNNKKCHSERMWGIL